MKDAFKRKSTLLICVWFILYVISTCIPLLTIDTHPGSEAHGLKDLDIITMSLIYFYAVPVLIGLVESICAIANKKAVFVLSVIQTVVSVLAFAITTICLSGMKEDGELVNVSNSIIVYLPIVACVLLLAGGIMFKKERAISGGAQ